MFSTKGVNQRLGLHFLMNSSQHTLSPLPPLPSSIAFLWPLRAEKLIKHTLISAGSLASCLRQPPHSTISEQHTHTHKHAESFAESLCCSDSNGLTSTIFLPGTGNHWTLVRKPAIDRIHIIDPHSLHAHPNPPSHPMSPNLSTLPTAQLSELWVYSSILSAISYLHFFTYPIRQMSSSTVHMDICTHSLTHIHMPKMISLSEV